MIASFQTRAANMEKPRGAAAGPTYDGLELLIRVHVEIFHASEKMVYSQRHHFDGPASPYQAGAHHGLSEVVVRHLRICTRAQAGLPCQAPRYYAPARGQGMADGFGCATFRSLVSGSVQ